MLDHKPITSPDPLIQTSVGSSLPPAVSVLMPTYNQASFLPRAVNSLLQQTHRDWELLVIDDGSSDQTPTVIGDYGSDSRIRYVRQKENGGFAQALNFGLAAARAAQIAYLPSDDFYYPDHLASLLALLASNPKAFLAYSGVCFHHRQRQAGLVPGFPLQLVQVMHRSTTERWTERRELVSDDLHRLFWSKLQPFGDFVGSQEVSCEWVDHPHQHHKMIRENQGGGLNPYRSFYQVQHPLRFHSSVGSLTDEVVQFARYRQQPQTSPAPDGLKILLVGELAFNPDRVLALEERGHRLYGLWMNHPWWLNTVGPLPFGHIEDLPRSDWRNAIRKLQPDLIYALLNWQAVPFVHEVLSANLSIPFVWHFKEGPWLCLERGTWPLLVDLHTRTDGQIYTSHEQRDWFATVLPGCLDQTHTLVIDGDLPKREWFAGSPAPRLSDTDGEWHTVVPGRPIGLHPGLLQDLAAARIHLHFYGDLQQSDWRPWVEEGQRVAPGYLHLHSHVGPSQWLAELSRYDAGWLHYLPSKNGGNLGMAFWDDLNVPARLATLMAAALPVIQYDNSGHIVATQTLARTLDVGLFCTNMQQLGAQLRETQRMTEIRTNVWQQRARFTFDYHVDELVAFFRRVMAEHRSAQRSGLVAGTA